MTAVHNTEWATGYDHRLITNVLEKVYVVAIVFTVLLIVNHLRFVI